MKVASLKFCIQREFEARSKKFVKTKDVKDIFNKGKGDIYYGPPSHFV